MKLKTLEIKTFYFSIYFHLSYPVLLVWIWRITKNCSNFYELWTNLRLVLVLTVPQFTTSIHKLPPPPLFLWWKVTQSMKSAFSIRWWNFWYRPPFYVIATLSIHSLTHSRSCNILCQYLTHKIAYFHFLILPRLRDKEAHKY